MPEVQVGVKVSVKIMWLLAEEVGLHSAMNDRMSGVEGKKDIEFEELVPAGTTLSGLIDLVCRRQPNLAKLCSAEKGRPPMALVALNGRIVSGSEYMTQLKEGDVVSFLPIMMGG